jgi:putative SOS response-associated peptidase YedK
MCGRFVSASNPEEIAAYFDAAPPQTELTPSYNVAPTTDIYAVVEGADGSRRVEVFHWGLIPVWAKDVKIGQKMINARAETVATKGAYKADFKRHRCLIPMDGFYEWHAQPDRKPKQPYFVHRVDGEPLAVAGLWSTWRDKAAGPDADWLHSCTIVTTTANATMATIHDRMPVILPASAWETWLDPDNQDLDSLGKLLVPAPDTLLTLHPISTDVNKVANDDAHLIDPIGARRTEGPTSPEGIGASRAEGPTSPEGIGARRAEGPTSPEGTDPSAGTLFAG